MFLLKMVSPAEDNGVVKEAADFFKGNLPLPLLRLSASQGALRQKMSSIAYYGAHPRLSHALLAAIRLRSAIIFGAAPCVSINTGILQAMGMGEGSLAAVKDCAVPNVEDLEENEQLMLNFIGKALAAPEQVTASDIEALRKADWQDGDIIDAFLQGETMHGVAIMEKAFSRD